MAEKKDKKPDHENMKKDAKLTALKDMRKAASDMLGSGLKDVVAPKVKSQVTVAADSPENLKKGLDKAKEMVPDLDKYMDEHEDMTRASSRIMEQGDEGDQTDMPNGDYNEELDHDDEMEEDEDKSPEDISAEEHIAELERKLTELKSKRK